MLGENALSSNILKLFLPSNTFVTGWKRSQRASSLSSILNPGTEVQREVIYQGTHHLRIMVHSKRVLILF